MKQVLQNLSSGETQLVEIPKPAVSRGEYLIETHKSLLSLGTEKMLLEFGNASLLGKARMQPEKVKQVIQKVKTDGLLMTLDVVRNKLNTPIPLGYSNVGHVISKGSDTSLGLKVGDRVVSNGPHAELVAVPQNLIAKIPDAVTNQQAAFTVVGSIGLQGIRLIQPTIGERIAVVGLGLIGLLCVQILRANGCEVLGIDFDDNKLALAKGFGAEIVRLSHNEDPVSVAADWTSGMGVDGVLITASSKSNDIVHQAATMCRKRGRIVLVGVVGLHLNRSDFYEKELSFQVSCSYGPGRYDPNYEKLGLDYPIGHVRWTEKRNFEAVLKLLEQGKLDVAPLVSHEFDFEEVLDAYESTSESSCLGVLLNYTPAQGNLKKNDVKLSETVTINEPPRTNKGYLVASVVGAGNFAAGTILPVLSKYPSLKLNLIVSKNGVSGTHQARKFGFNQSTTKIAKVENDDSSDVVFLLTPHYTHGILVQRMLDAGKHVFVEKPLCLSADELKSIETCYEKAGRSLCVGFNRRFSPHTLKMKDALASIKGPKTLVYTINAGSIPPDHWIQDPKIGGGRIIGEVCHFIDLLRYLVGCSIVEANAMYLDLEANATRDTVNFNLKFSDGSIASIHYFSNGNKAFSKERIEIFGQGRIIQCDNFRKTHFYGFKSSKVFKTRRQDKGHTECMHAFLKSIKEGQQAPIPVQEIFEVTRWSIRLDAEVREC